MNFVSMRINVLAFRMRTIRHMPIRSLDPDRHAHVNTHVNAHA
jgi:hypothetical protein